MSAGRRSLYVIWLLDRVWSESKKFREANPEYPGPGGKGCCYVGQAGIDVDERFKQHKTGYKSSSLVRKYGRYLMRRKCRLQAAASVKDAELLEAQVAAMLRRQGWAVWYN